MCGIFCSLYEDCERNQNEIEIIKQSVTALLERRGPDSLCTAERSLPLGSGKTYNLILTGTVLHLRGSLTPQPCEDDHGNILVWNGEIFDGIKIPEGSNDTSVLSNLLGNHDNSNSTHHVINTMSKIQGPWSFVYWEARQRRLWFGRDFFGRRSLLWHLPSSNEDPLVISSVAERANGVSNNKLTWEEVPADGIYCLEMAQEKSPDQRPFIITRFSWSGKSIQDGNNFLEVSDLLQSSVAAFNSSLPTENELVCSEPASSGASRVLTTDNSKSKEQTVIASEERIATGQIPLISKSKSGIRAEEETDVRCTDQRSSDLANELNAVLGEAVRKRVYNLPRTLAEKISTLNLRGAVRTDGAVNTVLECNRTRNDEVIPASTKGETCKIPSVKTRVGVLFSGGIDSIMLAALADKYVPEDESIDLINVAFEKKPAKDNPTNKKIKKSKAENCPNINRYDVPDRLTGKSGLLELSVINPKRQWNFIEIDVTLEELQEARSKYISHLVSPLNSVLDDSIGCALWFAARGSGALRCNVCIGSDDVSHCAHVSEYTSNAKVLLVGMGADEQLGGYARHRTKFNQHGWSGLIDEIEMEVARISTRNLGRDDRCISDHGREARFPFLDENVVSFLNSLPVWVKTDPRQPRGIGEKLLLRQAARLLGLTSSSTLPKRAIQFGSRIAKLESSNEKGSDACKRFTGNKCNSESSTTENNLGNK